jgi:4-hydroxy-tetrahydrodipicolinate synthase
MTHPDLKYTKASAKAHARQHFKGIWAATHTPFLPDLSLDETGYRRNLDHWVHTLKLAGLFVSGKQGEFFSLSVAERKRSFELAVEQTRGTACGVVTSCSDTNLDVVLDLARHSQKIGADYIVVHSPVLHFGADTDETIYEYYRHLSAQLDIGIALWNHPDCGYEMSPELCARIGELPNIVAIKYSVDRAKYTQLSRLAGDSLIVSNPDEQDFLSNILELNWQLYLCSNPPFLLQTATDQRINRYSELAFTGHALEARTVSDSLNPVRQLLRQSRPHGKPQAHAKYWMELLGQVGGPVRRPLLQLTDADRASIRAAFAQTGL